MRYIGLKNKGRNATDSENGPCHHPNVCNPEHVAGVEPTSIDVVRQCCNMVKWGVLAGVIEGGEGGVMGRCVSPTVWTSKKGHAPNTSELGKALSKQPEGVL